MNFYKKEDLEELFRKRDELQKTINELKGEWHRINSEIQNHPDMPKGYSLKNDGTVEVIY